MNVSLRNNPKLGQLPNTISSWLTKSTKVRNETLEAIDLLNFSDKIGKMLLPLGVRIGTGYHHIMSVFYDRATYEIGKIDRNNTSYTEFLSQIDDIIGKIFDDLFIGFIEGEGVDLNKNKVLLGTIHTKIRHFIKNRI